MESPSRADFGRQVADVYQHLYDVVYLRTHPLAEILIPDPSIRRKERAWQLHNLLLEIIKELDPGPHVPAFSREWRRHRLMVHRYIDGMDPQMVAQEIAVSRRQYYREHDAALDAIAEVLWDRHVVQPATVPQPKQVSEPRPTTTDLELLRLEAARLARAQRYTRVDEVVEGVLSLLGGRLQERNLRVHVALPEPLPSVPIERGLLRHMLIGMLGYLITCTNQAVIHLAGQSDQTAIHLALTVEPSEAIRPASEAEVHERLAAFEEMATLSNTPILPIRSGQSLVGFEVQLPANSQRTVLVVDDNEDVLELFQRYLTPHRYRVVTAKTVKDALDLAIQLQPDVITLDLMMPGQDGWDLLQALLNRPDTRLIPVIVCTVLKQKELALSLGAAAFLKKPVTEQELLSALTALVET